MKILDTKIFKSDWRTLRWGHQYEDKCWVHYSTTGKIADAVVTWGSNAACQDRNHKKGRRNG